MAIVTLEELLDGMNSPELTADQEAYIENIILPGVQDGLEDYLNRKIEKTRIRESLTPDEDGYIRFTWTPVWEVTEIMRPDGTLFDLPDIVLPPPLTPISGVRTYDTVAVGMVSETPFKYFTGYRNPYIPLLTQYDPAYWVTYFTGIEGQNDPAMKNRIIAVSAREVERKFIDTVGMRQGAIEPGQETDDKPIYWTEDELKQFDHYRRRVVV